jgi:hypothetical protein
MKRILLLVMTMIAAVAGWSQTTYTWNKPAGGAWNATTNWSPTRTAPAANDVLVISTGTSMTITSFPAGGQTVGKLSITNNSTNNTVVTLTGSTGDLVISGGTGVDFTIDAGSELHYTGDITVNSGATGTISGLLEVASGRTLDVNNGTGNATVTSTGVIQNSGTVSGAINRLVFSAGATYIHARDGGSIPTASWDAASNCNITGITSNGPATTSFAQDFGNVTWNSPSQTDLYSMAGELTDVFGDLNVISTGSGDLELKNSGNTTGTDVRGDFNLSGGTFYIIKSSNTQSLSVRGSVNITGGSMLEGGSGVASFVFSGTAVRTFTKTGGTITGDIDFSIPNNAIVDFGTSSLDGTTANFTLSGGGKIITSNAAGLNSTGGTGSILVGGTRSFSSTADYEFRGASTGTFSTNGAQEVNDLIINNTSGNVTLARSRVVDGNLTLTNGYVTTTAALSLTISTSGSATTANGAYVNGPLIKEMSSSSTFTFPVGKVTGGLRTIGLTTNSGTGTSIFTAQFFDASAVAAKPGATYGSGISRVSGCEYWTLDRNSGNRSGRVILSWSPASNCVSNSNYITAPGSLKVARHNGANPGIWQDMGLNSSNSTTPFTSGTITSNTLPANSFGFFTIGTTDISANPLPVLFDEVKAYTKNSGVQIEWSNLTERDIIKYEVERSATGSDYGAINSQLPKSNRDDKASYTYFDAAPLQGTNFYRIKVYEKSGKVIYSKVLKIDIGSVAGKGISLYPNPVVGKQLTIGLTGIKQGQYTLRVVNTAGQDVYRSTIMNSGNGVTQMIELPASVKPGVYTTVISGANYRQSKVFIVQ